MSRELHARRYGYRSLTYTRAALALTLIFTLIVCHGLLGGLHVSSDRMDHGMVSGGHTAHQMPMTTGGMGGNDSNDATAHGDLGANYAAVLFGIFLGAALAFSFASSRLRRSTMAAPGTITRLWQPGVNPVFAGGLDPPFLQVFRF